MGAKTKIQWTDATWSPIRARNIKTGKVGWYCEHATTGCELCYAEGMNKRLGTGLPFKPGHRKDVELFLDETMLLAPLRWKKPRMIFVCSMTDLFADFVSDEWIDKVFAVMALAPQHTFQVLTKRADRMRAYLTNAKQRAGEQSGFTVVQRVQAMCADYVRLGKFEINGFGPVYAEDWKRAEGRLRTFPLSNVWLGVSTERQQEADERIPHLLQTPAAVRFISAEPLLGPIDLSSINTASPGYSTTQGANLDWVIVGGESGPNARPSHPDWIRSLRDQCFAAGVAYFFKQWGEWLPGESNHGQFDPKPMHAYRRCDNHTYDWPNTNKVENFGTHADRWSGDLTTRRIGKARAGRLLDGREHNDLPNLAAKPLPGSDDQAGLSPCS